jgi:hypothetical protein
LAPLLAVAHGTGEAHTALFTLAHVSRSRRGWGM